MKEVKLWMLVLMALIAGCKENDNSPALLRGHEWQLKSITEDGKEINNPQQLPSLIFSDSAKVYGTAGCNRFFGTYTTGGKEVITIKPGGVTMMFCPDMNFEDLYLKALPKVSKYTVTPHELTLKDADGKLKIIYSVVDTSKRVGVANDEHGCNAAAGYTWSEIRQDCIRLFEKGVKFSAVSGQDSTLAAYVVFATDSLQAELFLPGHKKNPVLNRRQLPDGGVVWNEEDDDTYNVRQVNGKWVIEQRQNLLYSQAE